METRGTFSSEMDAFPAAEWHKHIRCQVTTLLRRCQVLGLQEKIKCGVSKWDGNTRSASNGPASRESPASGNQDNCLLCAALMVDLPAREWDPFIKVNLIAFLCGSAMRSLWLEGLYQQNKVGTGSWKCKAMVMLACPGIQWVQRDGGYLPNYLFLYSLTYLQCIWTTPILLHLPTGPAPSKFTAFYEWFPSIPILITDNIPGNFSLLTLDPPFPCVDDCPGFWIAILYHDNSPVFVFLLNLDIVPLILFSKSFL